MVQNIRNGKRYGKGRVHGIGVSKQKIFPFCPFAQLLHGKYFTAPVLRQRFSRIHVQFVRIQLLQFIQQFPCFIRRIVVQNEHFVIHIALLHKRLNTRFYVKFFVACRNQYRNKRSVGQFCRFCFALHPQSINTCQYTKIKTECDDNPVKNQNQQYSTLGNYV